MSDIFEVLAGARPAGRPDRPVPESTGPRLVVGRVHSVTPAGVRFVVPGWDEGRFVWGPARFSAIAGPPEVGVDCIVAFIPNNEGATDTWMLTWEGADLHVTVAAFNDYALAVGATITDLEDRVTSLESAPGGTGSSIDEATFWMTT